jgi:uridine kinase
MSIAAPSSEFSVRRPLPTPPARRALLQLLADTIQRLAVAGVTRVAIDGVDGAGKSVFGDELAQLLAAAGRRVIHASVDSFHNPRALRYRQGRHSPHGFFRDSYNYGQLRAALLDPLSPGGDGRYRTGVFDHRTDAPVNVPEAQANVGDILVFDGIFLHRPELRPYWEFSIFLEVDVAVSVRRCAQRDGGSPDPLSPENRRYVAGQQLYLRECEPQRHASVVINNNDLDAPYLVQASPLPLEGSRGAVTEGL